MKKQANNFSEQSRVWSGSWSHLKPICVIITAIREDMAGLHSLRFLLPPWQTASISSPICWLYGILRVGTMFGLVVDGALYFISARP